MFEIEKYKTFMPLAQTETAQLAIQIIAKYRMPGVTYMTVFTIWGNTCTL
jgi:hypothetical protein